MSDISLYIIVALLPLSALMLVLQVNPYHALIIRGVLGAITAMVDALLGAADVALTEALVGTMLAITLYAVAVRSSLVMRLGILSSEQDKKDSDFQELVAKLRGILAKKHLRLELVPYPDEKSLEQALIGKEIHTSCHLFPEDNQYYQTVTRIKSLYEILENQLSPNSLLSYQKLD